MKRDEVKPGQVYADNDPRMKGRTLKVIETVGIQALLEVLTNADDVQSLLDDETPGTRGYKPRDRRGTRTKVGVDRLGRKGTRGYSLIQDVTSPDLADPLEAPEAEVIHLPIEETS